MAFTTAEALSLETLQTAVLLAGGKGLHKPIKWVNILEILDDINLISPHELLITTAFGLKHDQELQQTLIPRLAEKKLSCLAIQTGYYLKEVPQKIIEDADTYHLPLVELPQEVSFSRITTDLLTRIVNHQFQLLDYRDKIRNELLQVVLDNGSFHDLLAVLSQHLKYPVRILDHLFRPVVHNEVSPQLLTPQYQAQEIDLLSQQGYFRRLEHEKKLVYVSEHVQDGCPQLILPIIAARNQVLGYISVLNIPQRLNDAQLTLLDQSATICALLFLQEIAVKETENRLQGDFLDDLLAQNYSSEEQIIKRAHFLGYDLEQHGMMLLAKADNFSKFIEKKNEAEIIDFKNRMLHIIDSALKNYTHLQFMTRLRSHSFMLLLLSPTAFNIRWQKELAHVIRSNVSYHYPELTLSIGIGRFYDSIAGFSSSHNEAEQALSIGHKLQQSAATAVFEELGFYRLLLKSDQQEINNFYQETVGKLASYDETKQMQLEYTLEVFLECSQNIQATAGRLFIHRHTLRYRLKRIEEIAGVNLRDADDIFNLQIGLKLHKILE